MSIVDSPRAITPKWIKVIDQTKCIGCHACSTACKSENLVPLGVHRTYVKAVETGVFPQVRRNFQVTRCNQCENPPCVAICPTKAMYQRDDGIVDFDKSICIGCKACMAACPYDAIFINPDDHTAEKCNLCAHRIVIGLEPACVTICPTEAILIGNANDPNDKVTKIIHREPVTVRHGEKSTRPKLFYKGADQSTLDPIAARQPAGDIFMWSQINRASRITNSGHVAEHHNNDSVESRLAYDISHSMPWGWKVSGYTWTKGIAMGVAISALLAVVLKKLAITSVAIRYDMPVIALAALSVTGFLLVTDLKQPKRFLYIFVKPHWKSWLVKGGFIIGADGAALVLWLLSSILGLNSTMFGLIGVVLVVTSVLGAIYTAYLFSQARARDLWQSPLRVPHLLVQALLLGSAALVPFLAADQNAQMFVLRLGALACVTHIGFVLVETTIAHPTSHSKAAIWHMTLGRYAAPFWVSAVAVLLGASAPLLGIIPLLIAGIGLLGYEHAYIQAGQSVPLA
ncbi:MAG: 4Fe-4S dicluster domain-containing protein [Actinomycetota bacterium]|nr:MAG: 4Fe-4S dicluster domain-containing protein [Actinomycetota bacterium]